ncbi:uncharacterized protein BDV14DRAFT_132258 [Aspergillus stella-maris]|uniref:uncharacterized protein n=1 Tax=Aspergillus stella-maris TaxID=1810926 RepID=UPI003CCCD683
METVQNAAQTASNAVWNGVDTLLGNNQQTEQRVNQHGDEPMSGIQGKGTVTDPYDAGNRDEQIGAPINKDNTAAVTQPLTSTTPGLSTNPTEKASLVTSPLDSQNPRIDHPEPVQGKQHTSGPAGLSTLKDEPLSTHKSTLKDESLTSSGPQPDKAETVAMHKSSAADAATAAQRSASGSGPGSNAERSIEQREPSTSASQAQTQSQPQPSISQSQGQSQPEQKDDDKQVPATQSADSETGGISPAEAAKKKGISPEALRGPSIGEVRQSYEQQKKSVGGKKLDDGPKTAKPG